MGPVLDREIEKIGMSLGRLIGTDETGKLVSADDVRRLVSEQGGGTKVGTADHG